MLPASRLLVLALFVLPAVATAEPVRVTGSLVGMDRESVTRARVELYPAWEGYEDALRRLTSGKREPEPLATAVADEHGRFEITAPASGAFRLTARREGHAAIAIPLLPLTGDMDLTAILLPKATPVEVRVEGPDGRPAVGIEVRITHEEGRRFRFMSAPEDPTGWRIDDFAVSGKDGKLFLPGADFGLPRLTVLSPGFLGQSTRLSWTARQESRAVFSLKNRNVRIEVRNGEGRPVPRALLRWEGRPLAVTGADGRLEMAVPEGDTVLTVESREGWRARIAIPAGASGIIPVHLEAPRKIAGKVVESDTGRPVAGALAWSGWPMAGPAARSDTAGAFQVEGPFGEAWANAAAADFFPGERQPVSKGTAVLKLQPSATLHGRVVSSAGQPVADAWIAASPSRIRNRESQQATCRSRADGSFRLTGLLYGGVYELTAARQGFARTKTPATTAARGKPSPAVTIVLSDGQTAIGRVVDEAGNPVEGAEVKLLSHALDSEESSAVSGPNGRFELRRLEPGGKMLKAGHPDHAFVFLPRIEIPKEAQVFDLGTVTLPASGVIEGRVTDTRGRPLEGTEVRAFPAAPERMAGWMFGDGERSGHVSTGPDGTFRIERLQRDARFDVRAKHPGYVQRDMPGVEAPTEEPVRIELTAARTLAGQVVNPEGEPVPGAELARVEDSALGGGSSSMGVGVTDDDGRFRVAGLPPGSVDFIVTADGYSTRRLRAVRIPETEEPDALRIVLERGSILEVRLTDAEGRPVPDVSVRAEPETRLDPDALRDQFPRNLWIRTDVEGRCQVQIPAPGSYKVSASDKTRSATAKVVAGPGATPVDLRFPPGVEVSGRVLSSDGSPTFKAYVQFLRQVEEKNFSLPVQADGAFVIEGVPDGLYRLTARDREGRSSRPLDLTVTGRSVTGLELVIDQESERTTLSGRISGLPPESLRGVQIEARPSTKGYGHTTSAGAGGEYRFDNLESGEWTVTATSSHGEAQGSVRLESGVPAVLDLEIAPGLTVSGRVLLDGAPLAGAGIRVMHRQGERGGFGGTAYDGTFKVHGLRSGPQILLVADDRGLGGSWSFDLQESRDMPVEIFTGRLRGRIVSESGEPLDDTEVRIEGVVPGTELSFSTPGARSGTDGSFEVRLGAGQYKIRVQKPGFAPFETTVRVPSGGESPVEIPLKVLAEP
jgi:protocatechuate 3,4-dioxygenase beta subunit